MTVTQSSSPGRLRLASPPARVRSRLVAAVTVLHFVAREGQVVTWGDALTYNEARGQATRENAAAGAGCAAPEDKPVRVWSYTVPSR